MYINNREPGNKITLAILINEAVTEKMSLGTGAQTEQYNITNMGFRGLLVFNLGGGWTAADLTIELTWDGTTWDKLRDEFGQIVRLRGLTNARWVAQFNAPAGWGAGAIEARLCSVNTASEANVVQTTARSLGLVLLR